MFRPTCTHGAHAAPCLVTPAFQVLFIFCSHSSNWWSLVNNPGRYSSSTNEGGIGRLGGRGRCRTWAFFFKIVAHAHILQRPRRPSGPIPPSLVELLYRPRFSTRDHRLLLWGQNMKRTWPLPVAPFWVAFWPCRAVRSLNPRSAPKPAGLVGALGQADSAPLANGPPPSASPRWRRQKP